MRKSLAAVPVAVLAAATLALAAGSPSTYRGSFNGVGPDTLIRINAVREGGEVTKVRSMRYRVPMNCEESGPGVISFAGWTFHGLRVRDDRRFSVSGGNGRARESRLTFKGRFSSNFKTVRGTLKTRQWFPAEGKLPAEYCRLPKTGYSAERG